MSITVAAITVVAITVVDITVVAIIVVDMPTPIGDTLILIGAMLILINLTSHSIGVVSNLAA